MVSKKIRRLSGNKAESENKNTPTTRHGAFFVATAIGWVGDASFIYWFVDVSIVSTNVYLFACGWSCGG
jgi:hypothetical protein